MNSWSVKNFQKSNCSYLSSNRYEQLLFHKNNHKVTVHSTQIRRMNSYFLEINLLLLNPF